MDTIFKYPLHPVISEVELPQGAEILTVEFQEHSLNMWAKIDTEAKTEIRNFEVFGTGHEMPVKKESYYSFIGTGFKADGLVFHVFEIIS